MVLRESKGNMYAWCDYTWNPLKGRCEHDCSYCYVKQFGKLKELRLVEKELKQDLGKGNVIFVGSGTDMFARDVRRDWIKRVLDHCKKFDNTYLFQTKNPHSMCSILEWFPEKSIIATTIETNRDTDGTPYNISKAPNPKDRAVALSYIKSRGFKTTVTIEPIIDFDIHSLVWLVSMTQPDHVSIGADSKGHNLPEPSPEKIKALIKELEKFTEVKIKKNLKRLMT